MKKDKCNVRVLISSAMIRTDFLQDNILTLINTDVKIYQTVALETFQVYTCR